MGTLRCMWRACALGIWTAICLVCYELLSILGLLFTRSARHGRHGVVKAWGLISARIIGMCINVQGSSPAPPYFLVANHLSYLDGMLLAALSGGIFVMMSEAASWPVFGFIVRRINTIFVTRQKRADTGRVNQEVCKALERGEGIIVFPESRISPGAEVCTFHSALLEPAILCEIPVHYATIRYEAPANARPASQWICWLAPVSFTKHLVHLLRQPAFTATVTFGLDPIVATDRKQLALQLHEAVSRQFTPVA